MVLKMVEHRPQRMSLLCTTFWMICAQIRPQCEDGRFGSECQFQCHCREQCNPDGSCEKFICAEGWFGENCQYQNLIKFYNATVDVHPEQDLELALDTISTTCVRFTRLNNITVYFHQPVLFSFMRFLGKDVIAMNITLRFKLGFLAQEQCTSATLILINNITLDYYCQRSTPADTVIIVPLNVKEICSLFISGGRNFALGQKAFLSSQDRAESYPGRAVDGVRFQDHTVKACAETASNDPKGHFNLSFKSPVMINRVVLYNTENKAGYARRMNQFRMNIFSEDEQSIFLYYDKMPASKEVPFFTVLVPSVREPAKCILIRPTIPFPLFFFYPIVTLCEIEAYGDCIDDRWGLECDKHCPSYCQGFCSSMDGGCEFKFRNGTKTDTSKRVCPYGHYGVACLRTCSQCYNTACNSATGLCLEGCEGYSDPPNCSHPCVSGHYGPNCSLPCHHCFESICNHTDGSCMFGCDGFSNPPYCNTSCSNFTYGSNCTRLCPSSCWNRTCDSKTHKCKEDCNGFLNPPICNEPCGAGKYGRNCETGCSQCQNSECDGKLGNCTYGCVGFSNFPTCDKPCQQNSYGVNCSKSCISKCFNQICDDITGKCTYGCLDYIDPPDCTVPCPKGHGFNCICPEECKTCLGNETSCVICKTGYVLDRLNISCVESSQLHFVQDEGLIGDHYSVVPIAFITLGVFEALLAVYLFVINKKKSQNSDGEEEEEEEEEEDED